MNENRQSGETPLLLPRLSAGLLEVALQAMPVVVVMGARQSGKSTLVKNHPALRDRMYVSLDEIDVLSQAGSDPDDLVLRAPSMTIDEVQREAGLILAIKRAVDEGGRRHAGRFVLTGSANLLLMERVSETLAGRATYVSLWPLTRRELLGQGRAGIWRELLDTPVGDWYDLVLSGDPPRADWRESARTGGYPTPSHEMSTHRLRSIWFQGYVQTYLERDLQNLASIGNLVDFHRLMRAMALRIGCVINRTEVSRDTGISRPTVHRHLSLLETSCQLIRVEAYSVNRTKRLIKSPKYYWSDTGLALHLSGEDVPRGEHLENVVLADLVAWRDAEMTRPQILYWRTTEREEVDFVIEEGDRLLPIEVKATRRPKSGQAAHLRTFLGQYPDRSPGALLLHAGEEVFWASRGVLAAPWWRIL